MKITFGLELLTELWSEIDPLLVAHYEELARFKDIPLAPDKAAYATVENIGMLRTYTVRDDGVLVGYAIFFLRQALHYSTSLQASQDVLFISPAHRGRKTGLEFLTWCDEQLRVEGVQVVYHHVKVDPALDFGPLLIRLGYEQIDAIYGKRLDGSDRNCSPCVGGSGLLSGRSSLEG